MIEQLYQSLLPSIEHFHSLAYWVAFVAAFVETALVVGLLMPGSTLLLLLGALSATGQIDFSGVFWFGVAGAVLGDNLNYWLGRRHGQRWLKAGVWFLRPEHFQQAHEFFDRNGAKSVFLGRFIPSIKEIAPFVAGSVGMHQRTFLFWNLLGAIGWGLQWIGGGYLFGQSLALAQAWMSRLGLLFLAALLLWLLLWYLKHILVRQGPQMWLLLVSLGRSVGSALVQNPHIRRFKRRHTRLMGFIAARLDRGHFEGLPLTLLVMTLGYVAILFGGIVEDFLTSDPIVAVDQAVAQLVARFRPPVLVPISTWVTALGVPVVAGPLFILASIGAWLLKGRWLALAMLVSFAGTGVFTAFGKLAFQRPRPMEAVLLETSYSFPSGHASIAVGFYGFLGYMLIRSVRPWKTKVNLLLATALLIALIGLSRIVLGVHYLSDVWAGFLVGAGWLVIGIALCEWAAVNGQIVWHAPLGRRQKIWALVISGAGLMWYLGYAANWHPRLFTPPLVVPVEIQQPLVGYLVDHHLTTTETLLGAPSQPLSVAFVAESRTRLASMLRQTGWKPADPPSPGNFIKLLGQGMKYTEAPLAPVFWNGRINDLALERLALNEGRAAIDTLRVWKTPWLVQGSPVFVAVTRSYTDLSWGLAHRISPDVDATAERLIQSLRGAVPNLAVCRVPLSKAHIGSYLLGMQYFTRGDLWVVDLGLSRSSSLCTVGGKQP